MVEKDKETLFFTGIDQAITNNKAFVAYKKPDSVFVKAIFQEDDTLQELQSFDESGYVFAPFDNCKKIIFMPLKGASVETLSISDLHNVREAKRKENVPSEYDRRRHLALVEKGIKNIEEHQFDKVVLSRKEVVSYDKSNSSFLFKRLLLKYPNAFVYVWFHPKVGSWLGATPEKLLEVKDQVFKTMALAGTQRDRGSLDVCWEPKERKEQQYVTDYIKKQLESSVEKLKLSEAYTVRAGSLLHLRTDVSGIIDKKNKGLAVKNILSLLHPTPATCGMPREEALKFILTNEHYDREYYTGFLGELNFENSSNIYVNLRCMQLHEGQASIYVGGGVTIESDPEKEWEETLAKANIMKSVL